MTVTNLVWIDNLTGIENSIDADIVMSSREFDLTRSWTRCYEKLESISKLKEDWDGMDADAPDPDILETAFKFIGQIRASGELPPSRIVAMANGGILVEWHFDKENRIEAEITESGVIEYCLLRDGSDPVYFDEPVGIDSWDEIAWAAPSEAATSAAA